MLEKIGINAMIDCVVTDNHEDAQGVGGGGPAWSDPAAIAFRRFFA